MTKTFSCFQMWILLALLHLHCNCFLFERDKFNLQPDILLHRTVVIDV